MKKVIIIAVCLVIVALLTIIAYAQDRKTTIQNQYNQLMIRKVELEQTLLQVNNQLQQLIGMSVERNQADKTITDLDKQLKEAKEELETLEPKEII